MDKIYNWWEDPKNKEEVEKISWWNHPEHKTSIELPVAIVNEGDFWVIAGSSETERLIGRLANSTQGNSREDAIIHFWTLMRFEYEYLDDCRLNYQRWVPFRKGDWKHMGGTWFTIFGIQVYFRHGKNMQHGWYVPFTKLNISISSEWTVYKRFKIKREENPIKQNN